MLMKMLMMIITNIMKIQVVRVLGFNCKSFLVFRLCLGRPISVVPEVTTEKLASADDILPFFLRSLRFFLYYFISPNILFKFNMWWTSAAFFCDHCC